MYRIIFFLALLQIVYSNCPDGFELVRDGECRGQRNNITTSFAKASQGVIDQCAQLQGLPIIIHNDEHQSYWVKHAGPKDKGYMILGLVCNTNSKRWEWADGSPDDYRPSGGYWGYNPSLDLECKTGVSWWTDNYGYWDLGNSANMFTINVFCTVQLEQPKGDGCETFGDDSDDSMCYQVKEPAQTWDDAQSTCQTLGSSVASIHNLQENSFIRRLAVSNGAVNGVFIGATKQGNNFGWTDGSAWDYQNFYPGFPIDGRGDCLAMDTFSSSGQWMNMDCSSKLAVACARQATPRPTCSGGPWKEGDVIYSPGYPYDASIPCDYFLTVDAGKKIEVEVLSLEANSCCDQLVLEDQPLGGKVVANLTGEVSGKRFSTDSSNFMRVSWQPNGGVNVRGMMITYRAV